MSSFFNSAFLTSLQAGGAASMTGVTVRMYVWPTAPLLEDNDVRYTGANNVTTVATLATKLGWGPSITQLAPDLAVTVNATKAPTYYLIAPNPFDLPSNFPDTKVAAISFVYQTGPDASMVGKLMFTTDTLFREEPVILYNQDGIIPAPDTVNVGPTNNRWLMFWNVPTTGPINADEGEIVLSKGTPLFEAARTQHVWMYPQRVNMIANPSFEAGVTHWKKSGALTQVSGGIDSAFYGHATGTSPIVLESNIFPVLIRKNMDEGWTVHITARGTGEMKIGLLSWSATYDETAVDWGPDEETWTLSSTSWLSFRTLRRAFDVSTAALRLETTGTFLDVDRICCEPGFHPGNYEDWPYFDGDSRYGALDDFSWYGDTNRPTGTASRAHKTYSCWYNHRRVVTGRLFQWALKDDGPGSVFTDEEVAEQGLVYGWVPAGTPVEQHLDVLYPGDPQSAVPDVTGTPTPRSTGITDHLGVTDPW